jgi:diguanylate cyclase (GGDEF)-like protein
VTPAVRARIMRLAPVVAVWVLAFVPLFAARRALVVPPTGMVWVALAALLAMLAALAYVVRRQLPRAVRQDFGRWIAVVAGPIAAISAAAGGLASPAAILPAGVVLAVAWKRGPREAGIAAAVSVVALAGLDLMLGRSPLVAGAVLSSVAIAGVGILPLWIARRNEHESKRARQRLARVEVFLRDRPATPRGTSVVASDLRKSAQDASREADAVEQMATLDRYLRDVRDGLGADEVIFWRHHASADAMRATAWSTEGALAPTQFRLQEWGPLVQWSAESDVVHCDEKDVLAHLVAGPVGESPNILGAISATSNRGFVLSREELRERVARAAGHVAELHALLEHRGEHHRLRRRGDALLRAVQQIQVHTSTESLSKGICETALDITEGSVATLVRWDAIAGQGIVEMTSTGAEAFRGQRVTADCLVGGACTRGTRLAMDDARILPRSGAVYGPGDGVGAIGSLGVVPLLRENRVLGAIVITGANPDPHIEADLRNVSLFAAVAATSLEMAWQIEEVSRRASTDQLTGLANRRHFDEQLQRVLAESDRSGLPASLIVADIDYFKRVNDNFGHEAGDAVLKHVAAVFLEQVRAIDICARYGGEEIALLLPQTDLAGAVELAERLRRAVAGRNAVHRGREIPVTSSFGVSSYPQTARTRDSLFPTADKALYQAKDAGRNCVRSAPVPRLSSTG